MEFPILIDPKSNSNRKVSFKQSALNRNNSEDLSNGIIRLLDDYNSRRINRKRELSSIYKTVKLKDNKTIKFEDYKLQLKDLMSGYKIEFHKIMKPKKKKGENDEEYDEEKEVEQEEGEGEQEDKDKEKENLKERSYPTIEESIIIKEFMRKYGSPNSSRIYENDIQIDYNLEDFTNPLQSYNVLENNRLIFEKINDKNICRQKSHYKKLLNSILSKPIVDIKRIKVTSILPRTNLVSLSTEKIEKRPEQLNVLNPIYNDNFELFAYYQYSKTNFPEGREQFSINYNPYYLILFGGISSKSFNDAWILDPIKVTWTKMNYENSPPNPRFGHSATLFQTKLILFGGKTKFNNYSINADVEIFNISEKRWEYPILNTKSVLKTRRNHAAELINNQILFHGGLSDDNTILNDFQVFNIASNKWMSFSVLEGSPTPALYGHSATLILPSDIRNHPKLSIFKIPEEKIQRRNLNLIKEKGIYMFGGKSNDNIINNDIYLVKVGRRPLEIQKLDTYGKPPAPRYFHTSNFYEPGNYMIIYGGRNDAHEDFAFSDIFILELNKMEWIEVVIYSDDKIFVYPRCGHSSVVFNNKLIVFGGMNNNTYIGSSLFFVELDYSPDKKEKILKQKKIEQIYGRREGKSKERRRMMNCKPFLPPIK